MSSQTETVPIGIIGGSGLYDINAFELEDEKKVETPFGSPSAPVRIGDLAGQRVAFLPRHGDRHEYNPTNVPYRANIWAMRKLGVFWLISVSAVGSLRKDIVPGDDMVIPDQIIDKTSQRPMTFYEDLAVHVGLSRPYHPDLRDVLIDSIKEEGHAFHSEATYVCMEGPAFSTKAESSMHRQWGADLIGMTAMPEARLAREAEMCYATVALPTDYDVWYDGDEVEVGDVVAILEKNIAKVQNVLTRAVNDIPVGQRDECSASRALEGAIMTQPDAISDETRKKVGLFIKPYIDEKTS